MPAGRWRASRHPVRAWIRMALAPPMLPVVLLNLLSPSRRVAPESQPPHSHPLRSRPTIWADPLPRRCWSLPHFRCSDLVLELSLGDSSRSQQPAVAPPSPANWSHSAARNFLELPPDSARLVPPQRPGTRQQGAHSARAAELSGSVFSAAKAGNCQVRDSPAEDRS